MQNKKPELLCPARDLETLRTAVHYGADAVYIGHETFSLRAGAHNFSWEEMEEAVAFCHARGKKVYVTANIFAHNRDLAPAEAFFERLEAIRPDAVLISDPGFFRIAMERCPSVEKHISTQANTCNAAAFRFWRDLGASRVVCAREMGLQEIREVHEAVPDIEIEAFVHGAMCVSYSGRCLLSASMAGRSANSGACAHPCRWNYALMEEKRPGEYMPVEEDARGTYIMNSRDLCMIHRLPDLIDAGVGSLKIEGRMKNALYVATTARAYRTALDDACADPELYKKRVPEYLDEIRRCTYRPYSTGFYDGRPNEDSILYDSCDYIHGAVYLGIAEEAGEEGVLLPQRNKFSAGDTIEVMKADGRTLLLTVSAIYREDGSPAESAPHPKEHLRVRLTGEGADEITAGDVLRSAANNES